MKRLLNSFKLFTLAAILISAMSVPTTAQSIDGCYDEIIIIWDDSEVWDCHIDGADDDWCYYTCDVYQ